MRLACFLAVLACSSVAAADPTKDQCVDADTRAQTLRGDGKLREARTQLDICISPACPAIVRQDCTERLDDVNRAQPTLVFDVKDGSGADIANATVTMDGQPFLDHIGGAAVPVDPGEHAFVMSSRGHLPNTQHLVVHEGDKDRRVQVVLGAPAETEPVAARPEPATEEEASTPAASAASPGSGQRTAGLLLGATGLAGLAAAGILTGISASLWGQSQNECSDKACSDYTSAVNDHNTAYDYAVAATVAVIGGGVLAGAGLIVFLTAPHRASDEKETSRFYVRPVVGSTMGVSLGGSF